MTSFSNDPLPDHNCLRPSCGDRRNFSTQCREERLSENEMKDVQVFRVVSIRSKFMFIIRYLLEICT